MGLGLLFGIKRAMAKMFQNRDTVLIEVSVGIPFHSKKVKGDACNIALRELPAERSHLR